MQSSSTFIQSARGLGIREGYVNQREVMRKEVWVSGEDYVNQRERGYAGRGLRKTLCVSVKVMRLHESLERLFHFQDDCRLWLLECKHFPYTMIYSVESAAGS